MHILHTEASLGWGGQEIRILRECEGMRQRGHHVVLACGKGAQLAQRARSQGFTVYELWFRKPFWVITLFVLWFLMKKHSIQIVNTHSSLDSWIGGITARLAGCRVIRTRHLSTKIRSGWNSHVLYRWLADYVVTTCEAVIPNIQQQAKLSLERCRSIPTGIDPSSIAIDPEAIQEFRRKLGVAPQDCLIGTTSVLRHWKGIKDMLEAAKLLEGDSRFKWVIVGGGVSERFFHDEWRRLGLEGFVFFTGHLEDPHTAIAAMDIFSLLSSANEGVSQASLQAAFLGKPLVTTNTGGLGEVCLEGITGFNVPIHSPSDVAEKVKVLSKDSTLRRQMGEAAHRLVMNKFTFEKTLNAMEKVCESVLLPVEGRI